MLGALLCLVGCGVDTNTGGSQPDVQADEDSIAPATDPDTLEADQDGPPDVEPAGQDSEPDKTEEPDEAESDPLEPADGSEIGDGFDRGLGDNNLDREVSDEPAVDGTPGQLPGAA
jgi:hypothetical protein